ncbi:MAG: AI-2E family transporter [Acidobacteriaceae bacterium]
MPENDTFDDPTAPPLSVSEKQAAEKRAEATSEALDNVSLPRHVATPGRLVEPLRCFSAAWKVAEPVEISPASSSLATPSLPARGRRGAAHLRTAGSALVNWWRAVTIQGLCVAVLWLIGLLLLHVPLAPVWALIAGLMTLVPNFGGIIALLGPAFAILVSQPNMYRLCFLLGLYALIVVIDQLVLQPMIMKRVTRVPIWASILVPIVLGIVIPFWGILLAPPLLAVVYAFRRPRPQA